MQSRSVMSLLFGASVIDQDIFEQVFPKMNDSVWDRDFACISTSEAYH